MLTGLYPKHHGVTEAINLSEAVVTLGETLRQAGYVTAGFVGHEWWLTPERGFAQGFDLYSTPKEYRDVFATHALGLDWLDGAARPACFLFLHNYDIHSKMGYENPYDPGDDRFRVFSKAFANPPSFAPIERHEKKGTEFLLEHNFGRLAITAEQRAYLRALYDDTVLKVDAALGELFEALRARGCYENALVIVTADHGESLGERNVYLHGDVYEHNIHVPLLIRFPQARFAGTRVTHQVQLVDLYPTVLDVLDVEAPQPHDGGSLLALLEARRQPISLAYSQRSRWRTVRGPKIKLIRNARDDVWELYDIGTDPEEADNLYATAPDKADDRADTADDRADTADDRADTADDRADTADEMKRELQEFFSAESGGWHMAFRTTRGFWRIRAEIETNDALESVKLVNGRLGVVGAMEGTSRNIAGVVWLKKTMPEDILVVKTKPHDAWVRLKLISSKSFDVLHGDERAHAEDQHTVTLDPKTPGFDTPPGTHPEGTPRSVRIWYERPAPDGTPAAELSEEAKEGLKALGYLH